MRRLSPVKDRQRIGHQRLFARLPRTAAVPAIVHKHPRSIWHRARELFGTVHHRFGIPAKIKDRRRSGTPDHPKLQYRPRDGKGHRLPDATPAHGCRVVDERSLPRVDVNAQQGIQDERESKEFQHRSSPHPTFRGKVYQSGEADDLQTRNRRTSCSVDAEASPRTFPNKHTFALIFKRDLDAPEAIAARRASIVEMVVRFVRN